MQPGEGGGKFSSIKSISFSSRERRNWSGFTGAWCVSCRAHEEILNSNEHVWMGKVLAVERKMMENRSQKASRTLYVANSHSSVKFIPTFQKITRREKSNLTFVTWARVFHSLKTMTRSGEKTTWKISSHLTQRVRWNCGKFKARNPAKSSLMPATESCETLLPRKAKKIHKKFSLP